MPTQLIYAEKLREILTSLLIVLFPAIAYSILEGPITQSEDTTSAESQVSLSPSPKNQKPKKSGNIIFESLFRPLEFREPIIYIPAEGRYGIGYYGMNGLDIFSFDPNSISYESKETEALQDIDFPDRFGHFIEFEGLQTNLSYLFFKKSYVDILTGLGFRYFSVFRFPGSGANLPTSWGVQKKFFPSPLEVNVASSFIFQWTPSGFLHLRYSYGLNRMRFYRDTKVNPQPYGSGTSSAYAIGIKFIRDSEKAHRYAWGVELRHITHHNEKIADGGVTTPIVGLKIPHLGLFFTFSAFYGGKPTIGDEGKKSFLRGDYLTAKQQLQRFIESHPHHARLHRAKKLIELCNAQISYQLTEAAGELHKQGKLDRAVEKLTEAHQTAEPSLKKEISRQMERVGQSYMSIADSLFRKGRLTESLEFARKASSVSDKGQKFLQTLDAKVTMQRGEDLAIRGLYDQALQKYLEALMKDPSLKHEIQRLKLKAAAGMLQDVNKAHDESSLRLALRSLYKAQEILGIPVSPDSIGESSGNDEEIQKIIRQLETQLSTLDQLKIQEKINNIIHETHQELAERKRPKIELGMLTSEVEDIQGKPHEITERADEKKRNYQLWIYHHPDKKKTLLYFEDYILFKIENE